MEPKNRKKIHFSVPVTHGHLDPKAVQMIRRRRPTPAALFRASDHSSPEEELSPHQRSPSADNGALKPKQVASPCPYRPPSVKGRCSIDALPVLYTVGRELVKSTDRLQIKLLQRVSATCSNSRV
ncbi:protein phosphatase 1 regulatory subunit 1B [Heptranchias perlo]|uniref:protein phosphatase 1 regulatory subunit 1B n=1 Tax=Heptranchias perlo TaxID=212740 RepID=UPI00355A1077